MSTDTELDTTVLSGLEFTPTLPCERKEHPQDHANEPASWVVFVVCPDCGYHEKYLLCDSGKNLLLDSAPGGAVVHCNACRMVDAWSRFVKSLERFAA